MEHAGETAELRVRFGSEEEPGVVARQLAEDLEELRQQHEDVMTARTEEADVGVGASGPGFAIILEVSRLALDDLDRLIILGGALVWLREKVRGRRLGGAPVISDSSSLGAVAAAEEVAAGRDLTGYRFSGCRPLTGWPEFPDETDERFLWAAAFDDTEQGLARVVFMSPGGVVLGSTVVPLHAHVDDEGWHLRTTDELRLLFARENALG